MFWIVQGLNILNNTFIKQIIQSVWKPIYGWGQFKAPQLNTQTYTKKKKHVIKIVSPHKPWYCSNSAWILRQSLFLKLPDLMENTNIYYLKNINMRLILLYPMIILLKSIITCIFIDNYAIPSTKKIASINQYQNALTSILAITDL